MTRDVSGRHIWVSSLTPFEYLCVEGKISTDDSDAVIIGHLKKKFTILDWPCGKISFSFHENDDNFFCVDKNKIAFIFKSDSDFYKNKNILDSIKIHNKIMFNSINSVVNHLKEIDGDIRISCDKFLIQKSAVTG